MLQRRKHGLFKNPKQRSRVNYYHVMTDHQTPTCKMRCNLHKIILEETQHY